MSWHPDAVLLEQVISSLGGLPREEVEYERGNYFGRERELLEAMGPTRLWAHQVAIDLELMRRGASEPQDSPKAERPLTSPGAHLGLAPAPLLATGSASIGFVKEVERRLAARIGELEDRLRAAEERLARSSWPQSEQIGCATGREVDLTPTVHFSGERHAARSHAVDEFEPPP